MDGAPNYMSSNNNGKLVKDHQQQQWGFVKEETFSSDHQFQWPAKNYSCNFCRREFKSAQALGGHMNVHRRDRARLRLLPSWVPPDHNSYPNPNFSFSPTPSCFTFRSNINTSSLSSIDDDKKAAAIGSCSLGPQDNDEEVLHVLKKKKKKKSTLVNLELKMGNLEGCSNEDLDLELHL